MASWRKMMRWIVVLFLGLTVLRLQAADSAMPASTPATKQEIVGVIQAQLAAFRKGDAAKAHSYSAAALRAQYPLRAFSLVVKQSYPEIWSNTAAEFGLARDDGQRAKILVYVKNKDAGASYDYFLVKERAGWRIEGVLRHELARSERL